MNIDGMSYRQWQKRNTGAFQKLSKEQQRSARQQGYYNIGWQKVQQSWEVLQQFIAAPTLFDAKLKKNDLAGAIEQSILEADQAQKVARQSVSSLRNKHKRVKKLAEATLNEYQLL